MRKLLIILLAVALSAIGIAYYLDARIPRATAILQIHSPAMVPSANPVHQMHR